MARAAVRRWFDHWLSDLITLTTIVALGGVLAFAFYRATHQ